MDPISYGVAAKQKQRIEKVIAEPDSTSGVITVPQVIASGENITVPAGRVAVLPNVQVDGTLNVQGDVFIPSGATLSGVVEKVTSTDNAVVRFDGTVGEVQNSGVVIDDNGNVGIGVAPNENYALDTGVVNGARFALFNVVRSGNGYPAYGYNIRRTGTNRVYNYDRADSASMVEIGDRTFTWQTAPVGTAGSTITWNTAMKLGAQADLTINPLLDDVPAYVQCYRGSVNNSTYIQAHSTPNSGYPVFLAQVDGVIRAAITSNGNYQSSTNSYGSTSDVKLKENVVDATPKLEKLMQVKVRNFNYIGDEHKQIGVVAQEIEKIFPSIVYETKDTKQVEVKKIRQVIDKEAVLSEDGSILEEATYKDEEYTELETVETGETTKNVKYSVIYMMMLKAMQEQQEIINDLKARVEVLEAK